MLGVILLVDGGAKITMGFAVGLPPEACPVVLGGMVEAFIGLVVAGIGAWRACKSRRATE